MSNFNQNKYETRLPMFNGFQEEYFQFWCIRVKSGLRSRELAEQLETDEVADCINERALSIIISELGDNPLQAIQSCITTKSVWEKLQLRYAGKSMVNKPGILKNLLDTTLKQIKEMRSHVAKLES